MAPKAKAAAPAAAAAPVQGKAGALALGLLAQALLAARKDEKAPGFPMSWPTAPYLALHAWLQQAFCGGEHICVVCPGPAAMCAVVSYCERAGAVICNVQQLQVRVRLAKSHSVDAARAELGNALREAMREGRRCVLLLADAQPKLEEYCEPKQAPVGALAFSQANDAAKALGLPCAAEGFHVVFVVQHSKAAAEKVLPSIIPGFDDVATVVLDAASLPPLASLGAEAEEAAGQSPSRYAALRLLALPPADEAAAAADSPDAAADGGDGAAAVNTEEFEWAEAFGEDWERRWSRGPSTADEKGKPIREGLITAQLVKYPSNPKDAKPCLQLVGGSPNSPCTGIWTSFAPLARPTEVEFEFTVMGKVDLPNATFVFTEKAFEGALPECIVGVQFTVRMGMQLAGGGDAGLVRISNDGKIQNDKWNKVLLKIDWVERVVVAQVDTRGKGYAPAVQTVPFRDAACRGFGFLYVYNTDVQATCWVHSLRVKQAEAAVSLDTEALDARAALAVRLKQREYQRAVDSDMEVGMKMGAIKSTKEHGMNLAQEQAANNSQCR
mmetsp:Transcript_123680/g.350241  ORF Transcript_123680/g.350241 Transcript_123680/m.350241 type:complete len:554 (-) Transcript_123680:72-1733(-)